MVVTILILEEALGVKSFSVDQEFELINHIIDVLFVNIIWVGGSIECLSSCVHNIDIYGLFKILLGENFINAITEFSP